MTIRKIAADLNENGKKHLVNILCLQLSEMYEHRASDPARILEDLIDIVCDNGYNELQAVQTVLRCLRYGDYESNIITFPAV